MTLSRITISLALMSIIGVAGCSPQSVPEYERYTFGENDFLVPKNVILKERSSTLTEAFVKSYESSVSQGAPMTLTLVLEGPEIRRSLPQFPFFFEGIGTKIESQVVVQICNKGCPRSMLGDNLDDLQESDFTKDPILADHLRSPVDGAFDFQVLKLLNSEDLRRVMLCSNMYDKLEIVNFHCVRRTSIEGLNLTYDLYAEDYSQYQEIELYLGDLFSSWKDRSSS